MHHDMREEPNEKISAFPLSAVCNLIAQKLWERRLYSNGMNQSKNSIQRFDRERGRPS